MTATYESALSFTLGAVVHPAGYEEYCTLLNEPVRVVLEQEAAPAGLLYVHHETAIFGVQSTSPLAPTSALVTFWKSPFPQCDMRELLRLVAYRTVVSAQASPLSWDEAYRQAFREVVGHPERLDAELALAELADFPTFPLTEVHDYGQFAQTLKAGLPLDSLVSWSERR